MLSTVEINRTEHARADFDAHAARLAELGVEVVGTATVTDDVLGWLVWYAVRDHGQEQLCTYDQVLEKIR